MRLSHTQRAALRELQCEQATAAVYRTLVDGGVASLLLKGPAIARWLWPDGEPRSYADADLLVRSADFATAERLLSDFGYQRTPFPDPVGHAVEYRSPDRLKIDVDLHFSFHYVTVSPDRCWELLSRDAEELSIAGGVVKVPCTATRAALLALHASYHSASNARLVEELHRAVVTTDEATWRRAAVLADQLGGLEAFAAALAMSGDGVLLAARMGLPNVESPKLRLKMAAWPPTSEGWLDLLATRRHPRALIGALTAALLPSPIKLQRQHPLARRGRAGLVVTYILRPFRLLRHSRRGFGAAYRVIMRADRTHRPPGPDG